MPEFTRFRLHRRALTRHHKVAIAGVTALGTAALAFSAVPSSAETTVAGGTTAAGAHSQASVAYRAEPIKDVRVQVTDQLAGAGVKTEDIAARRQAAVEAAAAKKATADKAAADRAAAQRGHGAAKKGTSHRAAGTHRSKKAASRSAKRAPLKRAARTHYGNNLNGWIKEALNIMHSKGIPGSYSGLHRNIMRESSGNPHAMNGWDTNAAAGIPSKGLLQVIQPTFRAYHVAGTSWNIFDPVANITAAANYAADRYGSIDNVNSAY
ncbi:transglycosylase SLT domain-containing protein [Streptomyces sp. NPDC047000]|uniref:transglycosylase SLT domain-containing protein n=1 Tax=Streptomyces sp. NPDC047000 TaxID=3155474 RepID=UPI0033DE18EB